jgi:hypothetical protein
MHEVAHAGYRPLRAIVRRVMNSTAAQCAPTSWSVQYAKHLFSRRPDPQLRSEGSAGKVPAGRPAGGAESLDRPVSRACSVAARPRAGCGAARPADGEERRPHTVSRLRRRRRDVDGCGSRRARYRLHAGLPAVPLVRVPAECCRLYHSGDRRAGTVQRPGRRHGEILSRPGAVHALHDRRRARAVVQIRPASRL